jgi:hypothetical protein
VRKCLVCDDQFTVDEPADTDAIGGACPSCSAPSERVDVHARHVRRLAANPYAVALGRLGGLKGGPARAAKLSAKRRREIALHAIRTRWGYED